MNIDIAITRLQGNHKKLSSRLDHYEVLQEERLRAVEKATGLATDVLNHRLEIMNEFRTQLNQERSTYVTIKELELKMEVLRKEICPLKEQKAYSQGVLWSFGIIAIFLSSIVSMAIGLLLK